MICIPTWALIAGGAVAGVIVVVGGAWLMYKIGTGIADAIG